MGDRGWHSRGYLPHLDSPGLIQMITYHLADSFPAAQRAEWSQWFHLETPEQQRRIQEYLDRGYGSAILRHPAAALEVERSLLHFDNVQYHLLAWTIMPNHVHVLIEPLPGVLLGKIVGGWKSVTARWLMKQYNIKAPVWQRDYHDRYIRDENHLISAHNYIDNNPVAGLVTLAEDYPFGSARLRSERGGA